MPMYEYIHTDGLSEPCTEERFEIIQLFSEDELTACPECGKPVTKEISVPSTPAKNKMSNSSLADKGFTKYVKTSDGTYTKVAGKGPQLKQPKS